VIDLTVFRQFPRLMAKRVILRQGLKTDVEAIFDIKCRSSLTANYAQEPHRQPEDSDRWLERARDSFANQKDMLWVVELAEKQCVIGSVTLWNLHEMDECAELGYEIHPDFEGRGYMSEAVQAVLDFGFNSLGLQRVEALPLARNRPSRKLLERNGFILEGVLRRKICFHDEFLDQCIYSVLRDEWRSAQVDGTSTK